MNKSGLSRQMKKAFDLQENAEAGNILQVFSNRIENLVGTLEDIIDVLKLDEDYKKAAPVLVPAIKELRSCYESLLKFEITAKETPLTDQSARGYWEQKFREENSELLSEMFDVLTPDERELYTQLNMKMTTLDNTMQIKLKEKFKFEDIDIEPESNVIVPDVKDKPFKRSKRPLKQEQEQEPAQSRSTGTTTQIPGGRRNRLARHKLGESIRESNRGSAIGYGSDRGGGTIPHEGGGGMDKLFKRGYADE